jgi:hypothetical protein
MSSIQKFHRRTHTGGVAAAPPWTYTLNGGTNVNITASQLASWGMPAGTLDVTITNTADIKSASTTTPAINFAADIALAGRVIKFINSVNCFIAGRGGDGYPYSGVPPEGANGGAAVRTWTNITFTNYGIVGGGGGGGTCRFGGGGGGAGGGKGGNGSGNYCSGGGGCGGGSPGTGGPTTAGQATSGSPSLLAEGGKGAAKQVGQTAGGAVMGGGGGGRYAGNTAATTNGGYNGRNGGMGGGGVSQWGGGGGGSFGGIGGSYNGTGGGTAGPALLGKSYVNGGAGLGTAAFIGGPVTQGTFYGSQS